MSVFGYCLEEVMSSVDDEEFKLFCLFIVFDFMGNGDFCSYLLSKFF